MVYVYLLVYFLKFIVVESGPQATIEYYLQFSGQCNTTDIIKTLDDCKDAATYLQNAGFFALNTAGGGGYDIYSPYYSDILKYPPGCIYFLQYSAYRSDYWLKNDRKMYFIVPTQEYNYKVASANCGTSGNACICKNKICTAGTYQDQGGQYECKTCPSGYFSAPKQNACEQTCPEGTFGNSETNACDVIEGNPEYAAGQAAVQEIIDDPKKYLVEQNLVTFEDGIRESDVTAAYDEAFSNATQASLESMTCNDLLHNYTQKCTCGWYDNDFWN